MKPIRITPKPLSGKVNIPPSKSLLHRGIIAAGLAEGRSAISNIIFSEDIKATLKGMEAFGVSAEAGREAIVIENAPAVKKPGEEAVVDCNESGSTLRFLIPLALLGRQKVTFTGRGKLVERPIKTYIDIFEKQNIDYDYDGKLPLTVDGELKAGRYEMRGDISSQFITGMMFALPLLKGDSTLVITTPLESKGYVDLTMEVLARFGIEVRNDDYKRFEIPGNQKYKAADYRAEGDYSQAAFWLVAGALGAPIECCDLLKDSAQGDRVIVDLIREMGGRIEVAGDSVRIEPSRTKGIEIDASQCPDLVPVLAVLASLSEGRTVIKNAKRLRIKESDRLKAISTELNKIGGDVKEQEDGLVIDGKPQLKGGTVNSWNDHRIVMALAVASIKCEAPVIIEDWKAIDKSYPHFFEDFVKLGGKADE